MILVATVTAWGALPCAPCHPQETAAFVRTPMGRSLGVLPDKASATFVHHASGSRFTILSDGSRMWQGIERGGLRAKYEVAYVIGSGSHGQGYLVSVGPYLFQSPIAFYSRRKLWDVAPGYEAVTNPDFNRPILPECLECHSGRSRPVRDTVNRYEDPAFTAEAITCERCHGPVEQHLLKPSRANIVNPERLPAAERDSVCEQCHLNGGVRILNPDATFSDFRPGQRLEDVFSVFVYDRPSEELKVVSHVEQLAQSMCARVSGKLWCGTCHNPHGTPINVRQVCLNCHGPALDSLHPKGVEECISCHMPKRSVVDGSHTAFTDHRIQRPHGPHRGSQGSGEMRAWREAADPDLQQRNLGLALITVGGHDRSTEDLDRGYRLLRKVLPRFEKDPEVLASLAMVLFLNDQKKSAARLLESAIEQRPNSAPLYEQLALVQRSDGDRELAKAALERAIALDPSRLTGYQALAEMQTTPERRREIFERYLRFNPQSIIGRELLRQLSQP